ncbi:MAG TPA: hypothetical protein DCF68_19995 [Cyanothece sp. UBA12306]|nr:hypothetical protein [Cyanothece sp. UBA12306]
MKKPLTKMTNKELRQYISKNRNDEVAFSQGLEVLMSRKKDGLKYPPPSTMNYHEIEAILKAKITQE